MQRWSATLIGIAVACSGAEAPKTPAAGSSEVVDTSATTDGVADSADSGETGGTNPDTAADTGEAPIECSPLALSVVDSWGEEADPRVAGWGATLADLDDDGDLDAVLAHPRHTRLLENVGGRLRPALLELDGGPPPAAHSVAAADLDADGDVDLFLGTGLDESDRILWNQGGFVFTSEVLPSSTGFTGTGTLADLDGDGRLDILVGRRFQANITLEELTTTRPDADPSSLYLQLEPGVFTDASERLPAEVHPAHTQEAAVIDVDSDGDLDLYFANDFGPFIVGNQLLINDGTGHFTVSTDCTCDLRMYGMAAAVGDLNGDAHPDLWLTDIGGPKLLLNDGTGAFYESALAAGADLGAEPDRLVSWGARVVDLDRDGHNDILTVFGHIAEVQQDSIELLGDSFSWSDVQHDALLLGSPDGFMDVGAELGFDAPDNHRAVVRGDIDGDGRDELLLAGGPTARVVDVAGGCDTGLRLHLDAGVGNSVGIGARVDVTVGERTWTGWNLPGGIGSMSEPVVTPPLFNAAAADTVVVTWPDGSTDTWEDLAAGTHTLRPGG